MRKFFVVLSLVFLFLNLHSLSFAQDRLATCDLCGYCLGQTVPDKWSDCVRCIYPGVGNNPQALENKTLLIDPSINSGPTPYPGHHYTMIGCLTTNLGGFTQAGAAASPIQTLLNLIFSLAGGIAFLYIIYGSFILITSRADIERLNYGRRVLLGAIVGLIFSLSAVFLVRLIGSQILQIPGFSR